MVEHACPFCFTKFELPDNMKPLVERFANLPVPAGVIIWPVKVDERLPDYENDPVHSCEPLSHWDWSKQEYYPGFQQVDATLD